MKLQFSNLQVLLKEIKKRKKRGTLPHQNFLDFFFKCKKCCITEALENYHEILAKNVITSEVVIKKINNQRGTQIAFCLFFFKRIFILY